MIIVQSPAVKANMKLGNYDSAFLKWKILHGLVLRRMLFGAFAFASAFLLVSVIQTGYNFEQTDQIMWNFEKCPLNFGNCTEFEDHGIPILRGVKQLLGFGQESHCMVKTIFQQLLDTNMLNSNANVLSVGEVSISAILAMGELGFTSAYNVDCYPLFSFLSGGFACDELKFSDGYFEFVFSRAVDKGSMPAHLVVEIERVLRPGGIGVMLIGTWDLPGNLISTIDAVSSYLKSSHVIDICVVGSYALLVFEKKSQRVVSFDQYHLPTHCPAITNNKPLFKYIEPLADERETTRSNRDVSYLPKYMNITSRNKLIYINIGVEEFTDMSVSNLVQPYRSIHSRNFNIFLIDHDISMLSSHVKNPGIVFIYHPGLSEDSEVVPEAESDEGMDGEDFDFDFIHWFKETVSENDFVVLRINGKRVSYDIMGDLFKSGAICHVDELFFHCPDIRTCKGAMCGDCMSLLKNLRDTGVFAHQWLGD